MLYYLIRLINPETKEVKFTSLAKNVVLPSPQVFKENPDCILEVRTGEMSILQELISHPSNFEKNKLAS